MNISKRARLGQYFLKDGKWSKKIVEALALEPGECVIEIGSGHGELTLPLLAHAAEIGARIVAIEKDDSLTVELRARIPTQALLELIEGDALKFLPETVARLSGDYKIVGNIPYYITGHLLRVIGDLARRPARVILMIQAEVGERLVAQPPKMNRLAASVQFWAEPRILAYVSRHEFRPEPKVDSVIVQLDVRPVPEVPAENYYRAVRLLFSQPRKTIFNNLRGAWPKTKPESLKENLARLKIAPTERPQDLSVAQISEVARILPQDR